MRDLIVLWTKRADKYDRMGKDSSGLNQEGLLAMADAIWVCIGELRRKVEEDIG